MTWRTVVISQRAKLEYSLNALVVRQGENLTRIHLSEIATLLVESTAVSLTAVLLSELVKHKIKVIFCDERYNPQSELVALSPSHDCSDKLRHQLAWSTEVKRKVWAEIVKAKIEQQLALLKAHKLIAAASQLAEYREQIADDDRQNREAAAARVYFTALFGQDFSRSQGIAINAALNYGYSVLHSALNREIANAGYNLQLGIFHASAVNRFNLGSDLIEPFRPLVDAWVYAHKPKILEPKHKHQLVNLLNSEILIQNEKHYLNYALRLYCQSVFAALENGESSRIKHYQVLAFPKVAEPS